jgi:quercetin dioxygenase-like cupin family protein
MKAFLTVAHSRACIAAIALAALTGFAQAGECPADKVKEGAVTTGEMMPKDVTDDVLSSIDLSAKGGDFAGQMLRLRKLVIQPGGIVPWHDHASRPANIYVVSGSVTEYRSNCEVPIVHNPGDTVAEFGAGLAHWWKNTGNEAAVLLSADLLGPAMDEHTM